MIVAIHQPNYLPWLGYFAKMARADVFVYLDDAQFSKGSYSNRVCVGDKTEPKWLTVPVSFAFGDPVAAVAIADPKWTTAHRDRLHQLYKTSAHFRPVWADVEGWFSSKTETQLAAANIFLIENIASKLNIEVRQVRSSSLGLPPSAADDRLADIVAHLAPQGTYLSGSGGASYQSEETYAARNIRLHYSDFRPQPYARGSGEFIAGLSVLDAAFHLGWGATADMVRPRK